MLVKALIAYDGTPFYGWQKTRMGPSIQGALEEALHRLTQEKSLPEAASRTDRGVHAEGQVIAFSLQKLWPVAKLQQGLNAHLPVEIRILSIEEVDETFHPTLNAKNKEYHYRVCLGDIQDPMERLYSWHFRYPIDLDVMEKAAAHLIGTRDFSAFANQKADNPVCTLQKITFSSPSSYRLQIGLIGDRFLYKMARTLAGTLLYAGCGKIKVSQLPKFAASKKREMTGVTAPAHGLFLHRVCYE